MKKLFALILCASILSCSKDNDDDNTPVPPGPQTVTVNMAGMVFSPATLSVKVGTIVKFNNNDGVDHTSTSTSTPPVWNSGTIPAGGSYSYTTTAVGTYPFVCGFHPMMTGTLTVTN